MAWITNFNAMEIDEDFVDRLAVSYLDGNEDPRLIRYLAEVICPDGSNLLEVLKELKKEMPS